VGQQVCAVIRYFRRSLTTPPRQSMHRSNPYLEGMSARDVRRSTVIDDGPFAFGVKP